MIATPLTLPSLLLLAAYALRIGSIGGSLFWLMTAGLALAPLPWKSWALAGLLGFGVWQWGDITYALITQRLTLDLPWLRLAAILGTVAVLCLVALLTNCRMALRNTGLTGTAQALAFLLTVAGLALARQKTSFDIILADRFFPGGGWVAIFLLGFYAAWVAEKLLQPCNSAKWRRIIWTAFSVIFFLQLFLGLLGFERFLMTGSLHLPIPALIAAGPLYRGDGFFMIILFAATLVLVGPAWCSHLCYFGAWDNLAATGKYRPAKFPEWTKTVRWLIFLIVCVTAIMLGRSGIPVSFALLLATVFGLGGIAVMFTQSRKQGHMAHCLIYCPMGLVANLLGKINPWRIRIDRQCCKCSKCSRFCRYGALTTADINRGRAGLNCSLCGDCISGCPHDHLHYTFPGLSNEVSRSGFIVVIVFLHTLFLGLSRL